MHRPDFVPVSTNSEMRHKFDQQGMLMEEKMGKKFFCCDAVLDTKSRQIEIPRRRTARPGRHGWPPSGGWWAGCPP